MSLFWVDETRGLFIKTEDFLQQVYKCKTIPKFIRSINPYDMLVYLVCGMISGKEMVLLDSDFSDVEITAMGIDAAELKTELAFDTIPVTYSDIAERIREQQWKLWMFTSGTTGLPKKVCHSFNTLGRNVRGTQRHKNDVWAFAYRFSHMAGIQVLLQALLNRNPIIYVFESSPQDVVKQIKNYNCTHISATPTFYRNIMPFIQGDLPGLSSLTIGGEKFDQELWSNIKKLLPNVRLHNIYASTETGSILNAIDDGFEIPKQYKDKVRISEKKELLIHCSLLGEFALKGEWYNTLDLVEERGGKLYFLSRKSDLINIGGYKVNPLEVEDAILTIPGVIDCVVKSKPNSVLGSVLIAEIVKDDNLSSQDIKRTIQNTLKIRMQPFKIPRIIKFVTTIERTRSGKKVRR